MSQEHDELRRLLGGYLLGGLSEPDTERLDAHLAECDECRDELERLAPVPELLQRLPEANRLDDGPAAGGQPAGGQVAAAVGLTARPSAANVEVLLRRMRAERTRVTRTNRVRWLAAAAVVLVAGAIGIGVARGGHEGQHPEAVPSAQLLTVQFEAAAGSGLSGEATLTPKAWGVAVSLDMSKLFGEGPFVCEVKDHKGQVQQAAIWGPTTTGNAKVNGASSFQLPDVSAVNVADRDGHVLGSASVD